MSEQRKQALAQALREYPTWGDAYLAEKDRTEDLSRVLLDVEGCLLAYWTDISQETIQELLPRIREVLGDYEPHARLTRGTE